MSEPADTPLSRTARIRPMTGRDPHERGRAATTLELLYDLVFVVAIGQAANQLGHLVAGGHYGVAIGGFAFAMFAVIWAWINFSWFASAFDTDDWAYRLATMVQMVGVTILGLGLPPMFHSLDAGHGLDSRVIVAGYVVMRVAMVFLWLRAARQSPAHRTACLAYVKTMVLAQLGWVATAFVHLDLGPTAAIYVALLLFELAGPYLAETRHGGTPWHAHHIAERYGLLTIIALGEGVIGTVASLSAVLEVQGWSTDAVLVAVAGMGLTFGMWWSYFLLPAGVLLHAHRERAFRWGYGSIPVLASIAATGAGLHVAALFIEHQAQIGPVATVLALAIPVGIFVIGVYLLQAALYADLDAFHALLLALTVALLAAAPLLAAAGVRTAYCLLVLTATPLVSVIGYEIHGHRHAARALARALGRSERA
ncbi:MAG: low temperature requirement protein A [Gemmatimonadales bacterium]